MRTLCLAVLLTGLGACSDSYRRNPGSPELDIGCTTNDDCGAGLVCFQAQCVASPDGAAGDGGPLTTSLVAEPTSIDYGALGASESRSMPIALKNTGQAMLELTAVRIEPASSTFRVDPMGTGPFWIRPGRSRDVFVTYKPSLGGANTATLILESQAPPVRVTLMGR